MGRQSELLQHNKRARKNQDLMKNLKIKIKTDHHHQAIKKSRTLAEMIKTSSSKIQINEKPEHIVQTTDLASSLPCGWNMTSKRGKPGKSIVVLSETITENNGVRAPESSRAAKGKAVAVIKGGSSSSTEAAALEAFNKQYLCSSCAKEFESYFALGGHRACRVKEERKWWGYSTTAVRSGKPPLPQEEVVEKQQECRWCKKTFNNWQGLAAHGRFCHRKKEQMVMGNRTAVVVRDFDLNELPPEAFMLDEFSG